MTNIHDFVKDLKTSKLFTAKQLIVIENLYIYIKDLKVYKVIIAVNPNQLKKAKKLGLNSQYSTTFFDDIPINFGKEENEKLKNGNYIALYNPNNLECSIFAGEETEEQQIKKLKNQL